MTPHRTNDPMDPTTGELTAALATDASQGVKLPSALEAALVAQGEMALRQRRVVRASRPRWREPLAWVVAAAAVLALVVLPARRTSEPARPTAAALLDVLRAAPGVVRVAWAPSTDPAGRGASGEVLWDAAQQRGVMRFAGLAPNDARVAQYQLWIVDAERDARYPVDGGVFDVDSEGEVVVAIDARLPVGRATLFAVTLEPPGGVVVSTRERLVLAAAVTD